MKWRVLLALLIATPVLAGSQATGSRAAVATSSRYATQAGLEILRRGGNAADASVAIAFVFGIGGGGTLLYYEAKSGAVWSLDFRENAPAGMTGTAPRAGVLAVGVPSTVAGMNELHRRFGSQRWKDLVAPAMRGADADLAKTLKLIASSGARAFYDGPIASRIVDAVRKLNGVLSLHDLSEYKPVWRSPIEVAVGDDRIVAPGPPSAGGMMLAEMLTIAGADLDLTDVHLFAETERRAAFDRDRFFADNGSIAYRDILSIDHAKQWRSSIDPAHATPTISLGESAKPIAQAAQTTHFTVVDPAGNVAAVTVENEGGLTIPGSGFALNDAAKNATRAGDRIPSSMTPAILLHGGNPVLALGSSGGAMAPAIVLQIVLAVAHGKPLDDAIEGPRFDQQATPEDITYETARAPQTVLTRLTALGHGVRAAESIGDVNAVAIAHDRLTAISDSRHKGVAGAM